MARRLSIAIFCFLALAISLIVACSGGDGDSATPAVASPTTTPEDEENEGIYLPAQVRVWFNPPAPPAGVPCMDSLERMIALPASTASGVVVTCEMRAGDIWSYHLDGDRRGNYQLSDWQSILIRRGQPESRLGTRPCLDSLDQLLPTDEPLPAEPSFFYCSMKRGQVSEPRLVWAGIREHLRPPNLDPNIDCLSLQRYVGELGPMPTVAVTCTWR